MRNVCITEKQSEGYLWLSYVQTQDAILSLSCTSLWTVTYTLLHWRDMAFILVAFLSLSHWAGRICLLGLHRSTRMLLCPPPGLAGATGPTQLRRAMAGMTGFGSQVPAEGHLPKGGVPRALQRAATAAVGVSCSTTWSVLMRTGWRYEAENHLHMPVEHGPSLTFWNPLWNTQVMNSTERDLQQQERQRWGPCNRIWSHISLLACWGPIAHSPALFRGRR